MKEEPIIKYSLIPSLLFWVCFSVFFLVDWLFFYSNRVSIDPSVLLYTPMLFSISGAYAFYSLWRRPVRKANFFEKRFEVSGRGVRKEGGYEEIESFVKLKTLVGDFRTGSSVLFSVRDVPTILRIPNRKNRNLGLDVYSLFQRNATGQVGREDDSPS